MGCQLIRPETGLYLTHCNGKSVPRVLEKFEEILEDLSVADPESGRNRKCIFSRSESFVPSFMEVWVFYKFKMTQWDENRTQS